MEMDNEIYGVATLTGIFMPAFMPPCCKFIEDGANFIHGKDTHRLIQVQQMACSNVRNMNVIIRNVFVTIVGVIVI